MHATPAGSPRFPIPAYPKNGSTSRAPFEHILPFEGVPGNNRSFSERSANDGSIILSYYAVPRIVAKTQRRIPLFLVDLNVMTGWIKLSV